MVTSTRTRAAVARARIHALYCGTNPMRGHESMRGRHICKVLTTFQHGKYLVAYMSLMVFAVTDIKIALSVTLSEVKWILCLFRIGEFSPFSFCNKRFRHHKHFIIKTNQHQNN